MVEKKKFRILAAGDIHGDGALTKRLAEKARREKVDLVILTGDITGWSETEGIIKPFKNEGKGVLLIPGNWDSLASTDFLANIYGVKNIHGYSVKYENIGIFGAGGAEGPGPGDTSEKNIMETLDRAHASLEGVERKIMVTHMHPAGSKSEFSGVRGSRAITAAIEKFQPDFLLHSHIHEAAGLEERIGKTRIINVGREGKIIEL